MLHVKETQITIEPSFLITLKPKTLQTYYIRIKNETTALRFRLLIKRHESFFYEDHHQQVFIILLLGIVVALFLYNLLLYLYTREIAYLYYCLYLVALVLQQLTYLGIMPLIAPPLFIQIDNLSVMPKVNGMYIMAALFAKEFLATKKHPTINMFYNVIIFMALIEIPLFGTPWFYYPEVGILTGLCFVFFNIWAALFIYIQGMKQARFFIAGWSLLGIGFVLMILDGLGFISVMDGLSNFILLATVLEALLLSLAFTDKYALLQKEKERSDYLLVQSLESQQIIIREEIQRQTKELTDALTSKQVLLKELHHRTKNNIQLILSIVRIEAQNVPSLLTKHFNDLIYRILAIAKIHDMLYIKENLQEIRMYDYIFELCDKIEHTIPQKIIFHLKIDDVSLPFKEAGYVGLILNEIIINSIKHAQKQELIIHIQIVQVSSQFMLTISDNGDAKHSQSNKYSTLGMDIIRTLVEEQLEGNMHKESIDGTHYTIRFSL